MSRLILLLSLALPELVYAGEQLKVLHAAHPTGPELEQSLESPRASINQDHSRSANEVYVVITFDVQEPKVHWWVPPFLRPAMTKVVVKIASGDRSITAYYLMDQDGRGVLVQPGEDGKDVVRDAAAEHQKDGALKLSVPVLTLPLDERGLNVWVGYTEVNDGLGMAAVTMLVNMVKEAGAKAADVVGAGDPVRGAGDVVLGLLKQPDQKLDHPLNLQTPERCKAAPAVCGGVLETGTLVVVKSADAEKLVNEFVLVGGQLQARKSKETYDGYSFRLHLEVGALPDAAFTQACRAALNEDAFVAHGKLGEVCSSANLAKVHQGRFERLINVMDKLDSALDPTLARDERAERVADLAAKYAVECGPDDVQLPSTSAPCRAVKRLLVLPDQIRDGPRGGAVGSKRRLQRGHAPTRRSSTC